MPKPGEGILQDRIFSDISEQFVHGDVLVINNTKVIPARLFGEKPSGGKLEIFVERIQSDKIAVCMIRANRSPKINSTISVSGQAASIIDRQGIFFVIALQSGDWQTLTATAGDIPLPPYIQRQTTRPPRKTYPVIKPSMLKNPGPSQHQPPVYILIHRYYRRLKTKA